jgi:tRNA 2-selenouridine synthase
MPRDARPVPVESATADLDRYAAVIDARSPGEFELDHLPGARNLPVLDDAQRAHIGTQYKHAGSFEAKREGAALVARNIAAHLEGSLAALPRDARCLVYCWRGGNRSGALATVMARVGWEVDVLEGGYRAFRRQVVADLAEWPARHRFHVIAGPTGCGKSLLLGQLARLGAQVLDLEALAAHRGSVLGHLPERPQPSQKRFESALWDALRRHDPTRTTYVESESRKVGQCQIPEALITSIRGSAEGTVLRAPEAVRCDLLMQEYRHFIASPERLLARLPALAAHHGRERVAEWAALVHEARWRELVASLLEHHYDPAYRRSMERNFSRLSDFADLALEAAGESTISALAGRLLAAAPAA